MLDAHTDAEVDAHAHVVDAELNAEAGHVTVNDNMEVHAEAEVDAHSADEDTDDDTEVDDDMDIEGRID